MPKDSHKIDHVNAMVTQMAPQLNELIAVLKSMDVQEFEIMVGNGSDKIYWSSGALLKKSPTQDELVIDLTRVLDESYPGSKTTFLGLLWNPNHLVATRLAEIVAQYRKRDRAQVHAQIVALLLAFQEGS